jgi:HD-GYP domain-containing protein (c-di-GMP phosphodiesterase class II)
LLAAEPEPRRLLNAAEFDAVALTIADFVDLRSPYTLGHSRGVAAIAETAAPRLGLPADGTEGVRRAGLLHDLGRLSVPAGFWHKREPLTSAEWEKMSRHPSLTELILARSTALGSLGTLGGLHHERLDGSGYRGVPASFQPVAARVLAAADAYQTKTERRPHRRALSPADAAHWLRAEAEQGRFDRTIVDAVVARESQSPPTAKRRRPTELTDRELEVLQLAVRGLSNREIAEALVVSPKTVGHHIQHIYDKIGVSTRVGATLFALQHGLVEPT